MTEPPAPPRRSGLLQERSRRTRQQLIRAALALWSERGFENGIEETTVEEIVQAAGVTKGTFYFHFSRKEEILLVMGWNLAAAVHAEALRGINAGRAMDQLIDRLLTSIARQVRAAPPAAVARSVAEFQKARRPGTEAPTDRVRIADAFAAVFSWAQSRGDLPAQPDAHEMAQMLEALVMDSILHWAAGVNPDLPGTLQRRAGILLSGLRALPAAR